MDLFVNTPFQGTGITFDSLENLYAGSIGNIRIYKITNTGIISVYSISGLLTAIVGLAFDSSGNLYCSNFNDNTIVNINSLGTATTFVNSGLNQPASLVFDSAGNLYCANFGDNTIVKINSLGTVTTFVNSGLDQPYGLAFDSLGNLYCSNNGNNTIVKINSLGVVTPFVSSGLISPRMLAFIPGGTDLYCSSFTSDTIFKITSSGTVTNFITGGLNQPIGLAFDPNNFLYCMNYGNRTITKTTSQVGPVVCFKEGTKILYLNNDKQEEYISIENLKVGDLVKTVCNDYVPISIIGFSNIYNSGNKERIKDRLYKYTSNEYPEITEELVLTGCHSVLVDNITDKQREDITNLLERIFITDDRYRLPACLDDKSIPYEKEGVFKIFHIALENENYYYNYGIYANGLLVETCSKYYLKELSNMTLIE